MFQFCGNTVSWKCNLQKVVSLSTTEAKFIVVTGSVKEAIWMKGMTVSLQAQKGVSKVYCDNQSDIYLAKNQTFHERTKDIDVKFHFVREIIESGEVNHEKINTDHNLVDVLTKALPRPKFFHCIQIMQIV